MSPSNPLFITSKFWIARISSNISLAVQSIGYAMESYMYFMTFLQKIAICIYMIPVRSVIIICHCLELTRGGVIWNMWALLYGTTFLALISIQTSASLFSLEVLKQQYIITYFNRSYVPHVLLIYDYWYCHFVSLFPLLHPLHPCWNILAICETEKQPINPTGFPAPFAPMIMHCCIRSDIHILCWYDRDVYFTMIDGKQ